MSEWLEIALRLGMALIIGFCIGIEREHHGRPAGIKTHIMVCMGAAIVSLIQLEMVEQATTMIATNPEFADALKADFGRLGAQVISGIGFLGAGTIIVRKNSVKGLTTAATLWLTACVGLAVGMGYYAISIISFIFVMIVLIILRFVQVNVSKHKEIILEIQMFDRKLGMDSIESVCSSKNTKILNVEFKKEQVDEHGNEICTALYHMQMHRDFDRESLIMDILQQTGIIKVAEHKDSE